MKGIEYIISSEAEVTKRNLEYYLAAMMIKQIPHNKSNIYIAVPCFVAPIQFEGPNNITKREKRLIAIT